MKKVMVMLFVALLTSINANANDKLIVIYDSGDTLPIAPYIPEEFKRNAEPAISSIKPPEQIKPIKLFPITTPSMTPGTVNATAKSLPYLKRPLFLIGSDELSQQWLQQQREQLLQLNAVGLLIEVKDKPTAEAIQKLADGLPIIPSSAESFAPQLGLTHYPVLVSQNGWEQWPTATKSKSY